MLEDVKLSANGLHLEPMSTFSTQAKETDQETLLGRLGEIFVKPSAVVVWFDNKVEIGLYQDADFIFYEHREFRLKYVQRLRIFDNQKELHIWRSGGRWLERLRTDDLDGGEQRDVVIAHQLLLGTKLLSDQEKSIFTSITEDRGATLHLPLAGIETDAEGNLKKRICIKTHNYITPNVNHQVGYVDCRFVSFTDGKENYSLVTA